MCRDFLKVTKRRLNILPEVQPVTGHPFVLADPRDPKPAEIESPTSSMRRGRAGPGGAGVPSVEKPTKVKKDAGLAPSNAGSNTEMTLIWVSFCLRSLAIKNSL